MNHRSVSLLLTVLPLLVLQSCFRGSNRTAPPEVSVGVLVPVTSLEFAAELALAGETTVVGFDEVVGEAEVWRLFSLFLGEGRLGISGRVVALDGGNLDPDLEIAETVVIQGGMAWVAPFESDSSAPLELAGSTGGGPDWEVGSLVDVGLVLDHPVFGRSYLFFEAVEIIRIS